MNYIEWAQIGTCSFISKDGQFTIVPWGEGKWKLHSERKGKFYFYNSLADAFAGARNIANFYRGV